MWEDSICKNIPNVPNRVYSALLDAGWTHDRIKNAKGKELFEAFCQWEGLINWSHTLWQAVTLLEQRK